MIVQFLINGAIAAGLYVLIGTGFHIFIKTTRFFNFAYGILVTAGAYCTLAFIDWLNVPVIWAILLGITLTVALGCTLQHFIFSKLSRVNASGTIKMICSLGIYIALQNVISLFWGDETKGLVPADMTLGIDFGVVHLTLVQLLTILLGGIIWLSACLFYMRTKFGVILRAVGSDSELSEIYGVSKDRVDFYAVALGSAVASISGVLIACDVGMNPTMGMNALMMGLVVVVIGGLGSIHGVATGALLLGFSQHLGVWKISSQWQDAITFIILLVFLLFRPQGFLGKAVKKATI